MLSGGKIPTIRSASNTGAKTSIGSIKTLGSKHLKTSKAKDGKEGNNNQEEDTEAAKSNKQAAEKNGTETSIDTKVKKLLKDVQKAREVDDKNPDPNAPINSENDPSRFDNVNKLEGNSKEDAAKNFGFSLPGTGGKQNSQQQAAQAAQQAVASGNGTVASSGGGSGGGGASSGSSGGGSSGGSSGGNTGGSPNTGGGIPGTGGTNEPGHGGGHTHTSTFQQAETSLRSDSRVANLEVKADGDHRDISFNAPSNYKPPTPDGYQVASHEHEGQTHFHINQAGDNMQDVLNHGIDPGQQTLASSDVHAEEVQQAQEQPQNPEPETHHHDEQVA